MHRVKSGYFVLHSLVILRRQNFSLNKVILIYWCTSYSGTVIGAVLQIGRSLSVDFSLT